MPSWPNISAAKSRTHYTARAMKAEAERDLANRRLATIRADAIEECARIADAEVAKWPRGNGAAREIAKLIRALKP